jgi:hypothetical protein
MSGKNTFVLKISNCSLLMWFDFRGRRLSRAERKTIRETRRMTIVDQKVQVEKKIDDFIKLLNGFQAMVFQKEKQMNKRVRV